MTPLTHTVLQPSSIRGLAAPWTYFLHLSLSSVILTDSSMILVLFAYSRHHDQDLRSNGRFPVSWLPLSYRPSLVLEKNLWGQVTCFCSRTPLLSPNTQFTPTQSGLFCCVWLAVSIGHNRPDRRTVKAAKETETTAPVWENRTSLHLLKILLALSACL